jgi:hypothetical protein
MTALEKLWNQPETILRHQIITIKGTIMSLDVFLKSDDDVQGLPHGPQIFVRESGRLVSISRDEWDERYPDKEPVTVEFSEPDNELYWANITHNLAKMAGQAGIYKHLWRPDEIHMERAGKLIEPLQVGLATLKSDPERFKQLNPSNGWGNYDGLVRFVEEYLQACEKYPNARIEVSR